uniref:Uncharacterized protein n=1 Tax=Amicula sp. isolate GU52X-4 cfCalB7 TaxID=3003489 RepID=A0A9E8YZB5_9STRA|nr:hypothetical protein [Amicula sp. isolate GU52X-4 cfCalB7]
MADQNNTISFIKSEYFDLLKYQKICRNQRKRMGKEKFNQLYAYDILIRGQMKYKIKNEYISIIKNYIKGTIDDHTFIEKFVELSDSIDNKWGAFREKVYEQGPNFMDVQIQLKSKHFSFLTAEVSDLCQFYIWSEDWEENKDILEEKITPDKFYQSINKTYVEMQNLLKEE